MANGYLRSLLGEDDYEQARSGALNDAMLMAGLQGLMASGPSLMPTSFGQIAGQAGIAGLSGYGQSMQQAERQALQGIEFEQLQQQQKADEAFKAALPQVFQNGKINYPALQQLALVYPERVGQIMTAYNQAQPPKAPVDQLEFDPKTGTIFNKRTGKVTRAEGYGQQPTFNIPENATPEEKAALYRQQGDLVAPTDPKAAKDFYALAESALKGVKSNIQSLQDLPTGVQTQISGVNSTVDAANSLIDMLGDYSQFDVLNPKKQADIQAAMRNLQLQAKEAYNLGVLNGPDLDLLNEVIVQPYSARGMLIGKQGIIDSIKKFQNLIQNRGVSVVSPYVGEENVGNFIKRNGASDKTETDLQKAVREEIERRKKGGQ